MGPLFLSIITIVTVAASETIPSPEKISELPFEDRLTEAVKYINSNAALKAAYEEHLKAYEGKQPLLHSVSSRSFTCDLKRSSAKPTSVHRLQPGDIDVVAAMGDSITGGNGISATTALGVLTQWRGESWSIGGDASWSEFATIPNFLRTVNPKLVGYSLGTGDKENPNAHLNVAKAGATADNIPIQARMLVDRMKTEPGVDFENDWKLITLFIGGNDICDCDLSKHNPDAYKDKIMEGLDILHAEVPKAFVNLVEVLDVSSLADLNSGIVCTTLHVFLCPCASFPITDSRRKNIEIISRQFQQAVKDIVESGVYEDRDDFTVVRQPFFENMKPPLLPNGKPDVSYFAPDCFHLSEKGHEGAAVALWNNMVEPDGEKRLDWKLTEPIECPTSIQPYFMTKNNSGSNSNVKSQPNLLGSQNLGSQPSLLGAKNVGAQPGLLGAQNVGVKSVGAGNPVADKQPAFKDTPADNSPSSGLTVTSSVILGCTLTLFVVLVVAFLARRKIKAGGKNGYQQVPEMAAMMENPSSPKYV